MDSTTITAIIGGSSTIIAAILGAIAGKSDFIVNLFSSRKEFPLGKKYESTWEEEINGEKVIYREIFEIKRQNGKKVSGKITMESDPDKEWDFEGLYNGRFLQLLWYPSKHLKHEFWDYGCYFLEEVKAGVFEGYAFGHDYETNKIEKGKHMMRRII